MCLLNNDKFHGYQVNRHSRTVGNEGWAMPAFQGLLLVCVGGACLMRTALLAIRAAALLWPLVFFAVWAASCLSGVCFLCCLGASAAEPRCAAPHQVSTPGPCVCLGFS